MSDLYICDFVAVYFFGSPCILTIIWVYFAIKQIKKN